MNSVFNFAIKRKLYDDNPVKAVSQFIEPPGRDRFTTADELKRIFAKCDELEDIELKVFVVIAGTTGMRQGEILPRKFTDVRLD